MVTALDTPIPYSPLMEKYVLPDEAKIIAAAKFVLAKQAVGV
jgi:pyruvate/2-oxoglutarate/acetoin dehydrogenase E1 component